MDFIFTLRFTQSLGVVFYCFIWFLTLSPLKQVIYSYFFLRQSSSDWFPFWFTFQYIFSFSFIFNFHLYCSFYLSLALFNLFSIFCRVAIFPDFFFIYLPLLFDYFTDTFIFMFTITSAFIIFYEYFSSLICLLVIILYDCNFSLIFVFFFITFSHFMICLYIYLLFLQVSEFFHLFFFFLVLAFVSFFNKSS